MYYRGTVFNKAGLCKKILFSKFLTLSQYIESLCHCSTALVGVARCHPSQAGLSCSDSLLHRFLACENQKPGRKGVLTVRIFNMMVIMFLHIVWILAEEYDTLIL